MKTGAFVFGSGLAIVPFLYGGVVKEYGWLNEQQFVDGVAVAMITPPVVITVGFIGYLVAGVKVLVWQQQPLFLPCYLFFTVIPALISKVWWHPAIKAFWDGVTVVAIGAIAGAVLVFERNFSGLDSLPFVLSWLVCWSDSKLQEPFIIAGAAFIGIIVKLIFSWRQIDNKNLNDFKSATSINRLNSRLVPRILNLPIEFSAGITMR